LASTTKNRIIFAFILILLTPTLLVWENASFVSANFMPPTTPSGIYIQTDGAVRGTDKLQRSGNTYTFTEDIYETIVVEKDDVVIDGAGFSLQGNPNSTGLFLRERDKVTIRNLQVKGWSCGVMFTWASFDAPDQPRKNILSNCTIKDNRAGVVLGDFSNGTQILGNVLANNTYSFDMDALTASSSILRNNKFENNTYHMRDPGSTIQDVDTSNTVDGKPIIYWVNQRDKTVPADAGFVVLKGCSNITVQGLTLSRNAAGIVLDGTVNSTITGNFLAGNADGVELRSSSNNRIEQNSVRENAGYGIYLSSASNSNIIEHNDVASNSRSGVYVGHSSTDNSITHNYVGSNGENGIHLDGGNSQITENNATANGGAGIRIAFAGETCTVSKNYVVKNGLGIFLEKPTFQGTFGYIVSENTLSENNGFSMKVSAELTGCEIYRNNFINNNVTEGLQVSNPMLWADGLFQTARMNAWDADGKGNYWSDYKTRYPETLEASGTGTGNTPFFINENNIDHHPLISPVPYPDVPSATIEETTATPPVTPTPPTQTPPPSNSPSPTLTPTTSLSPTQTPTQPAASPTQEPTTTPTSSPQTNSGSGFLGTGFPAEIAYAAIVSAIIAAILVAIFLRRKNLAGRNNLKPQPQENI
jgi:parallel beta-helix repeat protein